MVTIDPTSEAETKLMSLVKMRYNELEASMAIERCAAQISEAEGGHLPLEEMRTHLRSEYPEKNKRKLCESSLLKRKRIMGHGNQIIGEDAGAVHLPNPINGFGTPADLCQIQRSLPEAATGPPYFYYENVALTPKGVWSTISRFLYDVKPEFVGSKYFCAAARKRGYIHNLPIKNRIPLVPLLPQTISDAFPMTRRWWSTWDDRTKLNCLQTCIASATITERIMKALKDYNEDEIPPESVRRYVLYECRI